MKTTKLILCMMTVLTMLFAGCNKENNNDGSGKSLAGTEWQLISYDDETYLGCDVIHTVSFGQDNEISYVRNITSSAYDYDYEYTSTMKGTYTYSNGSGEAYINFVAPDEPLSSNARATFTVSGNTLIWHFNLKDITLTKL